MLTQGEGRIERRWVKQTIEQLQLREAPITYEVAMETTTVGLPHTDPADRLIASSAKVFDLTLITADEKLGATWN
jgi:PIN domain nuclease of toxin-antitoxin system